MNATSTATSTSSPRSSSEALPSVDRPLTTTPVMTLISGSAPSSFQRSGTPARRAREVVRAGRSHDVRDHRPQELLGREEVEDRRVGDGDERCRRR